MQKNNLTKYIQLHLIILAWGFTAIIGKLLTLEALPLVFMRIGITVGILFVYLKSKKKSILIEKKNMLNFLGIGVILAIHWFFFFYSIKISNVSIALATLSSVAFFTSIVEPLFFKRKIILYELILGLITVGGLCIIFQVESGYTNGIITGLICAFLGSIFTVLNGKFSDYKSPAIMTFYQMLGGVGIITIIILFNMELFSSIKSISLKDAILIFILSAICTVIPFVILIKLLKYISPYTVNLNINLEPVYGITLAYFIFGKSEEMSINFYIGSSIILLSIVLNVILKKLDKKKKKQNIKMMY